MASSKSKEAKKSVSKDKTNSEPKEDDEPELCPGFKDVDSFVKVSKNKTKRRRSLYVRQASSSSQRGQRGRSCGYQLKLGVIKVRDRQLCVYAKCDFRSN